MVDWCLYYHIFWYGAHSQPPGLGGCHDLTQERSCLPSTCPGIRRRTSLEGSGLWRPLECHWKTSKIPGLLIIFPTSSYSPTRVTWCFGSLAIPCLARSDEASHFWPSGYLVAPAGPWLIPDGVMILSAEGCSDQEVVWPSIQQFTYGFCAFMRLHHIKSKSLSLNCGLHVGLG